MENPTIEKFESYRQFHFLIHFCNEKTFYIDIDAFKRRGFGTMVYHFQITYINPENPKRSDIEHIMFFNRIINDVEIKYWPTEFEMAGLIWVVWKIRHMIKTTKTEKITVIFTDHAVNILIIKLTILFNKNINKFDLMLVRTFIYLLLFRLNVKYRPGKKNVIPNVLSRLFSGNGPIKLARRNPADILSLNIYFFGLNGPVKESRQIHSPKKLYKHVG